MFNYIHEQVILGFAQAYYMLELSKRQGLEYYIKEKPDHRGGDGDRTLAATVWSSDSDIFHVVTVKVSRLDITQLVSSEYDEYVYMSGSLFLIF